MIFVFCLYFCVFPDSAAFINLAYKIGFINNSDGSKKYIVQNINKKRICCGRSLYDIIINQLKFCCDYNKKCILFIQDMYNDIHGKWGKPEKHVIHKINYSQQYTKIIQDIHCKWNIHHVQQLREELSNKICDEVWNDIIQSIEKHNKQEQHNTSQFLQNVSKQINLQLNQYQGQLIQDVDNLKQQQKKNIQKINDTIAVCKIANQNMETQIFKQLRMYYIMLAHNYY